MSNYLPQLRLEFTEIQTDGKEIISKVLTEERLMMNPRHAPDNQPLTVNVTVNKALGSLADNCSVTIFNSPIIDEFRTNYEDILEELREKYFRVRIWAWYQPLGEPEPVISPVFVGDMIDSFGIRSSGLTDSAFEFTAHAGSWLARSPRYSKTYDKAGFPDKRAVVKDLFEEILNRGYGAETLGGDKSFVIRDPDNKLTIDGLSPKSPLIEKEFNVDRNPIAILDDICGDHDMTWGLHLNHPYMLCRSAQFGGPTEAEFPQDFVQKFPDINHQTGLTSMVDFGVYDHGFTSLINNDLVLGSSVAVNQSPQVSGNIPVYGRVNEVSYSLSNTSGHSCSVNASYLSTDGSSVLLPRANLLDGGTSFY